MVDLITSLVSGIARDDLDVLKGVEVHPQGLGRIHVGKLETKM